MSSLLSYLNIVSADTLYSTIKYTAGAGVIGSTLVATGLYLFQCRLIYPSYIPEGSRTHVPTPIDVGLPYEDVTLTTSDLLKIRGYVIPARRTFISTPEIQAMSAKERKERAEKEAEAWTAEMGTDEAINFVKSRPTVIIFHANAGNMGHRVPIARKFNTDYRCNVFMLSYRGYGLSEGSPSEIGMRKDVDTTMEYVSKHPLLGGTSLVVYGQSIGGAVCLYAASKFSHLICGVIIENTFTSLPSLIPQIMPQIPTFLFPFLLTERWDATLTLPHIPPTMPMLFLSGKRDDLVPPSEMARLRKLRGVGKMVWKEFEGGAHNDTFLSPGYWEEVGRWLNEEIDDGQSS